MSGCRHLSELYGLIAVFFALALMMAGVGCQPKTAENLGIDGKSQYELACHILDQAKQIEELHMRQPRKARKLANRNLLNASCLDNQSPWHSIRDLAILQSAENNGHRSGLPTQLKRWEAKLRPGGKTLPELEQEFLASMPSVLTDLPYERVTAVSSTDKANEEIRRYYSSRRGDAEEFVQKASKLETFTPVPLMAANAYKAKAQADWIELVSVRFGRPLPPEHRELLAQCEKLVNQVSGFQVEFYSAQIPADQPVRTL